MHQRDPDRPIRPAPTQRSNGFNPSAVEQAREYERLFGTAETPSPIQEIHLGPFSFLYTDVAIRRIAWQGLEIVRGISWPIRDKNWGTFAPVVLDKTFTETAESALGRLKFAVAGGQLVGKLKFKATTKGSLQVDLTLTPISGEFETNRAGLTVLHPILDLAGEPVRVTHSDKAHEDTAFPRQICPSQPIMDIAGLSYGVGANAVDIDFDGEVFEMEDQRNWSDASYKTYCVPLRHPFTYSIDRRITQSVRLCVSGGGGYESVGAPSTDITARPTKSEAPVVGFALEDGWGADALSRDAILACGASHLLVRVTPSTRPTFLSEAADLAGQLGAELEVELVLDDNDPVKSLQEAAVRLSQIGLAPTRLIALREAYLASHQPSGPWPEGADLSQTNIAARQAFPNVQLGGGMLTNFTEFNRARPDPDLCDYITHGSSAIVHASDDLSIIETLEALPHIYRSAQEIGRDKPYRLGLVSIGMRSNPYGATVAPNPAQSREAMAREDPRHRGLFGAAWAVGVLASTLGSSIEALCLAAPTGPFGVVYKRMDHPQAGFDDGVGVVYPLFHVVRAAQQMAGGTCLDFQGLLDNVVAYGVSQGNACFAMIANVSDQPRSIRLAQSARVSILDSRTFDAAVQDINWLENAASESLQEAELGAFAIGFARWTR